jgi:hypothetical protein
MFFKENKKEKLKKDMRTIHGILVGGQGKYVDVDCDELWAFPLSSQRKSPLALCSGSSVIIQVM